MSRTLDDLRTAWRSLRRRPGFSALVVVTLAVALGANTAVFGVLEQTLLRPLPFDGADQLVYLFRVSEDQGFRIGPTREQVETWREGAGVLEVAESFDARRTALLGHGDPREIDAGHATPGLFGLLGVRPVLGAGIAPEAGEDGARRAVLSHRLWHELFAGDPGALGRPLRLGDRVYTVVGVVGPELDRLPPVGRVDLWLPFDPAEDPTRTSVHALARLAPGVSLATARERIAAFGERREDPAALPGFHPRLLRPAEVFGAHLKRQLLVLQAAVALMLLIGCANVGNLFLVRAAGRRRELAVRRALGAGRGRIARALILESLVLSAAAAALGLALAVWGGGAFTRLRDWPLLDLDGLRLDPALFAFSAGAALFTSLAFALLPAWSASRSDPGETLRAASPGGGGGGGRAQTLLAVAEVALSLMLVVGAGLVTQHFLSLLDTETGFDVDGLTAVTVELPEDRYESPESQSAFLAGLREGLGDLDGIGVEVSLASAPPGEGGITFGQIRTEGGTAPAPSTPSDQATLVAVGPAYFRTVGIPILEGRALDARDLRDSGDLPVVVNRRLAERLWPGESPIGRRFTFGDPSSGGWNRVVGVAGDAAHLGVRADLPFQLYGPLRVSRWLTVLLRSGEAERSAAVDRVTAHLHALDPRLPVRSVRPVRQIFLEDLSGPRFQSSLMVAFAAIAMALAGLGVYAVLAFSVRRRSFEIGVRAALGARPGQVLALIGRQGSAIVLAGVALGTGGAVLLARLLGNLLGDVSPYDPGVYALAVAVLVAACACAVLVPATRAARLDPVRVLRRE